MPGNPSNKRLSALRLILVPAFITLGVTILRLTGELLRWSPRWFSTETGGIMPQGMSWLFGITWLVIPFGIYFALKLIRAGEGPPSINRALVFALLGIILLLSFRYVLALIPVRFPTVLIFIWLFWALAGGLQFAGWPALSRILVFYGLAARIPVALVMFFAMLGNWGTHYDYVGITWPPHFSTNLMSRYLWLAFFPQLVAWVAFTVAIGMVAGVLAALIVRRKRQQSAAVVS